MKPNLAISFLYTIVLSLTILLSPTKSICSWSSKADGAKTEKQNSNADDGSTGEILHGEILFKY